MTTSKIDDYRVYVDTQKRLVCVVFTAGGQDLAISVNKHDTQKIIDALGRALQNLDSLDARH